MRLVLERLVAQLATGGEKPRAYSYTDAGIQLGGKSAKTIYRMVQRQELMSIQGETKRDRLISAAELDRWVSDHEEKPRAYRPKKAPAAPSWQEEVEKMREARKQRR